jgi:hypothetical protein
VQRLLFKSKGEDGLDANQNMLRSRAHVAFCVEGAIEKSRDEKHE